MKGRSPVDEPAYGVPTRRITDYLRSLSDEELGGLYRRYGSAAGIARRFGVTPQTVRGVAAKRGFRPPSPRRGPGPPSDRPLRGRRRILTSRPYLTLADLHRADFGEFERWVEAVCRGTDLVLLAPTSERRRGARLSVRRE